MIRSVIYDTLIVGLTASWYAEVLRRVPSDAALLDVGIGTAGALLANAERVQEKRLRVTGLDIDGDYIARARDKLLRAGLQGRVQVRHESVYDHHGGPYDAAYFSASFMLLPEPERALRHCCSLLRPDGRIYFTQTIQLQRSRWMETIKPLLKRVTSIDFGRVTYEEDFRTQIRAANLELEAFTNLARHGSRASVLAVAKCPSGAPDCSGARSP
ncbi:MAG: class I SAM-dependent methyltransferase [Gammaproteobacteria bacterium]|nr:MAG: class I SAM-dependent methyltransferase [Gammaproteobacteria bacterium]